MTLSLGVIKETFQSKSEQGGDKTFLLGGADPNAIMHSFQSRLVDHKKTFWCENDFYLI